MGVLPNRKKVFFAPNNSDGNTNSSDDDAVLRNASQEAADARRVRLNNRRNSRPPPSPVTSRRLPLAGTSLKLKKGRRSKRRYDNERNLFASVDIDPEVAPEGWDIARESSSHFTALLDEANRDLLDRFLLLGDLDDGEESLDDDDDENDGGEQSDVDPESCYLRISYHLRKGMKKGLHRGMLSDLESQIRDHFTKKPGENFVASDLSSYERLLAHICSMYNCLNSHSYDENGARKLKIVNPRNKFNPIDPSLYQYLNIRCKIIK